MPSAYLPEEDQIVRYVPWSKLRKDEDENVLGVVGVAFRLREDEEFLSATWLNHFPDVPPGQMYHCVQAIRNSSLKVGTKSGFAIGAVGAIKSSCLARGKKIRVIHEPEPDNSGHTALRQWPRDDEQLLDLMAEDALWGNYVLNKDIP